MSDSKQPPAPAAGFAAMAALWKKLKPRAYPVLAPALVFLLTWIGGEYRLFERFENLTIDWRFRARAPWDKPADPRLILVQIDAPSLDTFGKWPWPRTVHGDFLQLAALSEPAVVAFDILFTEPGQDKGHLELDQLLKQADLHLAKSLAGMPCAITGAMKRGDDDENPSGKKTASEKVQPKDLGPTLPLTQVHGDLTRLNHAPDADFPIEVIRRQSYFGFVDCEPTSSDGIRRSVPMMVRIGRQVFPSLSFQALCHYWKAGSGQIEVDLGKEIRVHTSKEIKTIPINEKGELLINYRNKKTFIGIGYSTLMKALANLHVEEQAWPKHYPSITGKLLLVGQTQEGLVDLGASPLDKTSPLVLVHFNALNNILQQDYLRIVPIGWTTLGWLLVGWISLFALRQSPIWLSITGPLVLIIGYIAAAFGLFYWRSIQLPLFGPMMGFAGLHFGAVVFRWLEEQKSKRHIKGIFSSYITKGVMDQLLQHPENIKLGGVRKPVTILFSDIRGFTTMTESSDETALVRQLNEYFEKMVDCVNLYQGTLHKYIGDAVMAVWGDVVTAEESQNAQNGVRAALAMRKQLKQLNEFWVADHRTELHIGIGLNHGAVVVGNIGAPQKMEFTVIGDAVNLASRLEGLTKQFKTDFVISESVRALLSEQFLVRTVGLIQVKGKTRPVRVFEVMEEMTQPDASGLKAWTTCYEEGFEAYLARRFVDAVRLFEQAERERPADYCTHQYLTASRACLQTAPPADWTGVLVMESK